MESPWFNENDRMWNIYSLADCRFGVTHQASGSGEVGELALNFVITTGHNALPAKKNHYTPNLTNPIRMYTA